MATQTNAPVMFVRGTWDTENHMAESWKSDALCGARPRNREIGWMFGANNAIRTGITAVCADCQEVYPRLASEAVGTASITNRQRAYEATGR